MHDASSHHKIELLEAGRAVAALSVIAFHANLYRPVAGWLAFGALGVDFFFVLSGFIIHHLYAREAFNVSSYASRRIMRIFVPYLPVGIGAAVAYTALGYDFDWSSSLLLTPGKPALTVAWTLQRELVFYVLAALFFISGRPFVGAIIWCAMILLGAQIPLNAAGQVVLDPHNLQFVVGMALARFCTIPNVSVGRAFLFLGGASYSLYLVHLPAMGLLWRMGASFLELIAGSIVAGVLYHLCLERPLLRRVRKFRFNPQQGRAPLSPSAAP